MIKTTSMFAMTLLATSTMALAQESDPVANSSAASPEAVPATAPTEPTPAPPSQPAASQPAPVAQVTAPEVAAMPEVNSSDPRIGWGHGARAPMYASFILSAGALSEDSGNRLTTRDSKLLDGFGGIFRIGAVLDTHNRVGARMQSFVRPTKKILLDSTTTTTSGDTPWGAVSFGYIGPEYLFNSDFGLYAGGSVGVAAVASTKDLDKSDDSSNKLQRASAGGAAFVSVGYEWRASKWFAMNVEAYGGLYHGVDDNDTSMNSGLFGFGMGAGF